MAKRETERKRAGDMVAGDELVIDLERYVVTGRETMPSGKICLSIAVDADEMFEVAPHE